MATVRPMEIEIGTRLVRFNRRVALVALAGVLVIVATLVQLIGIRERLGRIEALVAENRAVQCAVDERAVSGGLGH